MVGLPGALAIALWLNTWGCYGLAAGTRMAAAAGGMDLQQGQPFRSTAEELRRRMPHCVVAVWGQIKEPKNGKVPQVKHPADLQQEVERGLEVGFPRRYCEPLRPDQVGYLQLDYEVYLDLQPTTTEISKRHGGLLAVVESVFGADETFVLDDMVFATERHRWAHKNGQDKYKAGGAAAAMPCMPLLVACMLIGQMCQSSN